MKHIQTILLSLTLLFAGTLPLAAQSDNQQQFFQMPVIPADLVNVQDRSDYLVEHFWDFCDLNKAFSSREKMADAFDTYLEIITIASRQSVYKAVPEFMKKISKKPENVMFIADLAENRLYGDSAVYPSDELFTLFLNGVLDCKKIDKTSKLRYEHLRNVLTGSAVGAIAPKIEIVDPFGQKSTLEVDTAKVGTILFFNDPDCDECRMARLRLDTDILTRRMVNDKVMDIVCIYPSDPDVQWTEAVLDYPAEWKTVAAPDAYDYYDLRHTPMFYVLNPNGAILVKTPNVDSIIALMSALSSRISDQQ
ncbi:MAG: DUF5106 domain-containing protein [Bacteroides sp.]|nr:DUF5106 domain-containing protein [Bacteroides sp.]MCM1412748.1 DUF5106 domain-containing protein [Bacteroides sp.]MCM1470958.1 DUF5106 domain-containing protein [Bacteroides sp.]